MRITAGCHFVALLLFAVVPAFADDKNEAKKAISGAITMGDQKH